MTDNEIKKALEYRLKVGGGTRIDKEVLDLINRLQAEKEELKNKIVSKDMLMTNLITKLTFGSEAYKYLACDSLEFLKVKAEAHKECIEKVKQEIAEALKSNYKAKAETIEKHNVGETDEFISYCQGKIDCLIGLDDFLDDLLIEMKGQ